MSRFIRAAHFKELTVKVGDWLEAGKTPVGIPGDTGHAWGVHIHLDGTLEKPVSWWQYKNRPRHEYFDTGLFWKNVLPYDGMYLTNRHGTNGHIGVDINCPDDAHKTAYAPATGRVVYVEPPLTIKRRVKGNWVDIDRTYGGGFGHFFWMELDESQFTQT